MLAPTTETEETSVRAFFITTEASKYEPLTAIVENKSKYETLLSAAKSELKSFKNKYNTLKELTTVMQAINNVL